MIRFAHIVIAVMSVECLATAIAFAATGNWKMAAYWFCVSCINAIAWTF